jgi:hypothetical protein
MHSQNNRKLFAGEQIGEDKYMRAPNRRQKEMVIKVIHVNNLR